MLSAASAGVRRGDGEQADDTAIPRAINCPPTLAKECPRRYIAVPTPLGPDRYFHASLYP